MKNLPAPQWFIPAVILFTIFAVLVGVSIARADDVILSQNFMKSEFNQRHDPLPLDDIIIEPLLVQRLENLRHLIGDKPIVVISGYRDPKYNAAVGGVKHSQHMVGKAADIRVAGMRQSQLAEYARIAGFTFVKTYSTHVHVDVR